MFHFSDFLQSAAVHQLNVEVFGGIFSDVCAAALFVSSSEEDLTKNRNVSFLQETKFGLGELGLRLVYACQTNV